MADIESNINLDINASGALATLRTLQRQISAFQQTMSKTGAVSSAQLGNMQQNLVNSINSTGQFTASVQRVTTTTESFTRALETNKLSMGQYFRFAGSQVVGFRKLFSTEFDTIDKVARERVKTLQTQYIKLGRDASGAMQAISVRPQVLDMDDLATKTAIATQKTQLFNQLMRQGSTELLNFGKNTQWAGRQLMVGFTIPLGIMGAAAAREFKAIEEQVIRLERVYGDFTTTMADTEQATAQIKSLADEFTKYGVAVSKTIGLAADAAAMGSVGADLVAQVAEATRLAVLGGVQQEQALETTISLTSAFGVAREDLAKKTDFLNAVENQTMTSIEDLTTAIPKAGPVVQQLGGNVEDLTFFLTAMREGGINASESANALKSGLASLINPTAEASEMLNGFGINLQGIVEANKGNVKGIVVDFASALDTLDPLNRAQAIEQLFGKFQFSRLSTLFQNVIKEGGQASRVLELTQASASELAALSERELGKVEASPLFQFEGAIERFKAALAPVGEEFMKAVTPLINFGTDLLNSFNNMSEGGKQFAVILTGAIAGIAPIALMTFGLVANGVANLIKLFMFVKGIFDGTGRSSNLLTDQLQYMNTEQMKAAAIASSLGQVHTNLIQTFNAEAGAVRNLAGAYSAAIATQAGFMGPLVGSTRGGGKAPKKMSKGGVVMVPGTGRGDKVPAMLEPGEAVIPTEMTKRYGGLINGMIAGSIPGYNLGKTAKVQESHTQRALDVNNSDVIDLVDSTLMPGFRNLSEEVRSLFIVLGDLTATLPEWYNQDVRVGKSGVDPDVHDATWQGMSGKYDSALGQSFETMDDSWASLSDPITRSAIDGLDSAIGIAAGNIARSRGVMVDDDIIAEAVEQVVGDAIEKGVAKGATDAEKRSGEVAGVMKKRMETPGTVRFKKNEGDTRSEKQILNELVSQGKAQVVAGEKGFKIVATDKNGKPVSSVPLGAVEAPSSTSRQEKDRLYAELRQKIADKENIDLENLAGLRVRGRSLSPKAGHYEAAGRKQKNLGFPLVSDVSGGDVLTREGARAVAEAKKAGSETADKIIDGYTDGIVEQSQIASPAKKTRGLGQDTAKGYELGLIDGKDDVARVGKETGQVATSNTNPAFGKVAGGVTPPTVISPSRVQHFQGNAPKIVGKVPDLATAQAAAYGGMNIMRGQELQFARGAKLLDSAQAIKPMALFGDAAKKAGIAITTATNNVKTFVSSVPTMTKTFVSRVGESFKQIGVAATNAAARAKAAWDGGGPTVDPITGQTVYGGMKGKLMGGVGKVAAGGLTASMGLGMLSMFGVQGSEIAGQIAGPLMAISSIAQILSMFPALLATLLGPVGLVVAGVAALGIGLYSMHENLVKTRDAAKEAAEATAISATNTQRFAESAGTFDPIAMKNQRENFSVYESSANAESSWAKSFLESDPGKQMKESIEKAISESGRSEAAAQFASQLGTMVASGVLSAAQAQDFAAQIGLSLQDTVLSAKISAELLSLIGPNGEDLTKDPMTVYTKLVATTSKDLEDSLDVIANTGFVGWGSEEWDDMVAAEQEAAVGFQSMVTQSGQLLANMDNVHVARLAELEAAGDLAGIQEETSRYEEQRKKLIADTTTELRKQLDAYKKLPKENQNAILRSTQDSLKQQYKDTELEKKVDSIISGLQVSEATSYQDSLGNVLTPEEYRELVNLEKAGGGVSQTQMSFVGTDYAQSLSNEAQLVLTTNLSAGNISVEQFERLQDFIKPGDATSTPVYEAIANVSAKISGDAAGQLTSILSQLDKGQEQVAIEIAAQVNAKANVDPEAAQGLQDVYQGIQAVAGNEALEVAVEWDDTKMAEFQGKLATIDALDGRQITSDYVMTTFGLDMSEEAAAWFNSLSAADVKTATYAMLTVKETIDTNTDAGRKRLRDWAETQAGGKAKYYDKGNKIKGANYDYNAIAQAMQVQAGKDAVQNQTNFNSNNPPPPPPFTGNDRSGGGGGSSAPQEPEKPPTSFLDSVVKDMRQFTTATQGLTENFVDSMNAIRSSSASAFGGLSQQLRGVGIGEDVISLMTGMSKEEWDEYKGQFFNFDAAGNITGFKADLTAISDKLRTITLGKFVDEQQRSVANTANQALGLSKLVSLGMSYANAYKMVEDAALAAAIANAKSADEIRKIIDLANQARQAQTLADASKSLANTNDATDATIAGLNAVMKYSEALTEAQVSAILGSEELQTMLANFDTLSTDQLKVINEALQDAADKEALEIKIKLQTPEGTQELFNKGFSKAMEQFSAKEQEIRIRFKLEKDPFEDAIEAASRKIADIKDMPGGLDDLEADLQRINDQEIDINKKYSERFKALDSISKVNERIAAQQRTQLSLSEALSMGDIAAAARAAQEMRAQDAAQALVDQREALQKSQELELENLMGNMGMTREQIEARIRDIKKEIFEIEEKEIEVAQYQLELVKRKEESEINSLMVLNKTKEQWEQIKNSTDLARTTSYEYEQDMLRTLNVADELIKKWEDITKPKTTIHTIIEEKIASNEAAEAERRRQQQQPQPSTQPPPAPTPQDRGQYTVVRGDTLWAIASRYYGNGNQWPKIYNANRNVIGGNPNLIYPGQVYTIPLAKGGMVPQTKPIFGKMGTDTTPAMLTPGEFVVKKYAVDKFGADNLKAINNGSYNGGSVYNNTYSISVNANTNASPDEIARTVMTQIKRVDAQRIRGNRF
jgi:TP901 family phage tail tape measure protein